MRAARSRTRIAKRAASELCSSRAHATAPANSATAALFGDDLDDGHVAEVLAPAKTKKRVTINLFGDESVNDTIDVSDAIEMATGETTEFIDPDDVATLNKQRLVDNIFNVMPAEWDEFFPVVFPLAGGDTPRRAAQADSEAAAHGYVRGPGEVRVALCTALRLLPDRQ